MVDDQLVARGVASPRVLEAMRRVPRHAFVPAEARDFAYADSPLPIGAQQTISQPYVVALMVEAATPAAADRMLEIGTGSGYAAAVLAELVAHVDTIERIDALALGARRVLHELGYTNIDVHIADGTIGLRERAPFDAIIATAGGPSIPDGLCAQLAIGGRLVMPVGPERDRQRLVRMVRVSDRAFEFQDLCAVQFVPLIGQHGWQA